MNIAILTSTTLHRWLCANLYTFIVYHILSGRYRLICVIKLNTDWNQITTKISFWVFIWTTFGLVYTYYIYLCFLKYVSMFPFLLKRRCQCCWCFKPERFVSNLVLSQKFSPFTGSYFFSTLNSFFLVYISFSLGLFYWWRVARFYFSESFMALRFDWYYVRWIYGCWFCNGSNR